MKNILVTGGGGYVGTNLVNELLSDNYTVTVLDTFWFGNYLKKHKNLKIIKKDIREISEKDLKKIDCIMHLASIANDPAAELDAKLTWDVNVLATYKLINLAINQKVKKFIFASSGSVYGVKKEKKVTENLSLIPISEYNKTKMIGEKVVESFKKKMKTIILRPATVCGPSKNHRLDLTINMLTYQATKNKKINVFGGSQYRPNLTLKDMINIYHFFIRKNLTGTYNVGFENEKVIDIAKKIAKKFKNIKIQISKSNDLRSYRLDSSKLLSAGYKKTSNINEEIIKLKNYYISNKFVFSQNMIRIKCLKKILKNKY